MGLKQGPMLVPIRLATSSIAPVLFINKSTVTSCRQAAKEICKDQAFTVLTFANDLSTVTCIRNSARVFRTFPFSSSSFRFSILYGVNSVAGNLVFTMLAGDA